MNKDEEIKSLKAELSRARWLITDIKDTIDMNHPRGVWDRCVLFLHFTEKDCK